MCGGGVYNTNPGCSFITPVHDHDIKYLTTSNIQSPEWCSLCMVLGLPIVIMLLQGQKLHEGFINREERKLSATNLSLTSSIRAMNRLTHITEEINHQETK